MTPDAAPHRRAGVVVGGLLLAGAALLLAGTARSWIAGDFAIEGTRATAVEEWERGATTAQSLVRALGLAALASVVAVFAVRGFARRILAVLLVCVGVGAVAAATPHLSESVLVALCIGGGALVAWGGIRTWVAVDLLPSLASRYDREKSETARPPRDAWEAIDRGEDPTA